MEKKQAEVVYIGSTYVDYVDRSINITGDYRLVYEQYDDEMVILIEMSTHTAIFTKLKIKAPDTVTFLGPSITSLLYT